MAAQAPAAAQVPGVLGEARTVLPDGSVWLSGGWTAAAGFRKQTSVRGVALEHGRGFHTATVLPDGKVFVFGGAAADRLVAEMELYDPATGTVEELAKVVEPRSQHTATLLTDGRVLLAGGVDARGELVTRLEVWDPVSRTLETLPETLREGKKGHVARLLANGNVLVGGEEVGPGRVPMDSDDLKVAASLPLDGAKDAPVDRWVAVRFTRPAKPESLNTATVVLRKEGEAEVSARVVAAEAGMLLFVTPLEPLAAGANYELSIVGAGSDSGAVMLPTTIRFQTAAAIVPDKSGERGLGPVNPQTGEREELAPPPLQAAAGVTALYGHVRTVFGRYLDNVTMRLECGRTEKAAVTDRLGRFLVTGLPAGHCSMEIDATTAQERGREYGRYFVGVDLVPGRTNLLPYTIWMTPIDRGQEVNIPSPTTRETVITHPRLRGLELRLPAGAVIRDYHGQVIRKLGITPIPINRPPFPLPKNVPVPVYFTIQPGGAFVEVNGSRYAPGRGAQLVYPNQHRAPAGRVFNFWDYDPDGRGWYVYGRGKVSANRKSIVPDPGVVIYRFSGAMVAELVLAAVLSPPITCIGSAIQFAVAGYAVCLAASMASDLLIDWDSFITPGSFGDPVDPATGLFVHQALDLAVPDVLNVDLVRTYRPGDHLSRAFGVGSTHQFDVTLVGDRQNYTEMDLLLPTGSRIHFVRISPGMDYPTAVLEHTATSSDFYKSRITWNGDGWDLKTKSGVTYTFPEAGYADKPQQGALTRVRDRFGNTITLTRNRNDGNLQRITSPNNRWIEFTYDSGDRIVQARTNAGQVVTYEYDEGGRLVKVINPLGGSTEFTYDANNQMLTVRDARGVVIVTNEYDDDGRVSKQTLADGGFYRFVYTQDSNGNIVQTEITDPRGIVSRILWNLNGYFSGGYPTSFTTAVGLPEQLSTTFEWEAATSRLLSATDGQNRKISFTYEAAGRVSGVTRLAGTANATTRTFSYEPIYGLRATTTDALNRSTTFSYDSLGRLTGITDPSSTSYAVMTNAAGQITGVTMPGLGTFSAEYNSGLISALIDPAGNRTSLMRDAVGRVLAATNAMGETTRAEYDAANQLKKVIDPLQAQTQFGYNAAGGLLSVTDARNGVTAFTITPAGYIGSRTDALLRVESFEVDKNGNTTKRIDRKGQVTSIVYDGLNRPKTITFHDNSTMSYSYGGNGRISQIIDSIGGTRSFTYDAHDRVATESGPKGMISYEYDATGRRTSMTVAGQSPVTYTYNVLDQVTQIAQGSQVTTATYDSYHRLATLTLPGQVICTVGYDGQWRVSSLSYSRAGVSLGTITYAYDAAGRVISMGGGLAATLLPAATTGVYNSANQLTQWNAAVLNYDLNGNLISDGVNSYTWDPRDQLSSVSGAVNASFAYDSGGRRLQRSVSGSSVGYLHDGLNVVQELAGTTPSANLIHGLGLDSMVYRADSGGSRVPLTDLNGSTIALVDANGVVQTRYSYEAFGATAASGAASTNAFQYTGREADGTGLYHLRARYYHPGLHRFISEDPLGFGGGDVNLYAYAGNSPTNATDPLGTTSIPLGIGFPGGLLGTGMRAFSGMTPFIMIMQMLMATALRGVEALVAAKMMGQDPSGGGNSGNSGLDSETRDRIVAHALDRHRDDWGHLGEQGLRRLVDRITSRPPAIVNPGVPGRKGWVDGRTVVIADGTGGGTVFRLRTNADAVQYLYNNI